MHDILLSKIAANATDTTWSQAYSTINFYLVISISSSESEKSIAAAGKELLERIQREFFALDEKNLENIKAAVTNGIEAHQNSLEISVLLASIVEGTLYLVSYGPSIALLKRGEELGLIAQGDENQLSGFSGFVQPQDIVILETAGFAERMPPEEVVKYITSNNVVEISEGLTPVIHENAQGNEAAIILQYVGSTKTPEAIEETQDPEELEKPVEKTSEQPERDDQTDETSHHAHHTAKLPSLPKIKLPTFAFDRKKLIIGGVVIIAIILLISILHDSSHRQETQDNQTLQSIMPTAQKDYDDAIQLASIQKELSVQKLQDAQATLLAGKTKLAPGSSQEQQLNDLLQKVDAKLKELQGGTTVSNTKVIFNAASDSLKTISFIQFENNQLIVGNSQGAVDILSTSGSVQKYYDGKENPTAALAATDNFIFEAGDKRMYRIDRGNSSGKDITTDSPVANSVAGLATYGDNLYLLNSSSKDVEKYVADSYDKSSYFKNSVSFKSAPESFAIDGSIWIIEQNGMIHKFTKGVEDPFTVTGLPNSLGKHLMITTDVDYTNLYVLDSDNSRLVTLGKDGTYKNQYTSSVFKQASSVAVDEASKTAYIVADNKVLSLPL